jgi:hypothetical protein
MNSSNGQNIHENPAREEMLAVIMRVRDMKARAQKGEATDEELEELQTLRDDRQDEGYLEGS